MTNPIRLLETLAQIVYGEDAWVCPLADNTVDVFRSDRDLEMRGVTIQVAVAHLVDTNQKQQTAFKKALRELGESNASL